MRATLAFNGLSKFAQNNSLLFPLKLSENHSFLFISGENEIRLNLLNI